MSNTCFTTYKIVGKKESIAKLHKTIKDLDDRQMPLVENEWYNPKLWLGCLVAALGGNPDEVLCRGTIIHYELKDDVLTLNTEAAWTEMAETRHYIERSIPDLRIYYLEEEEGCELFNTNDAEGVFFWERYYLDSSDVVRYFCTLQEVADYAEEVTGKKMEASFNAIKDALKCYADAHEDDDTHYDLFEIKVCDD